jgi:anti-sigma B factor antagonist
MNTYLNLSEGDRRRARLNREDFHCTAPNVLDMENAEAFGDLISSIDPNSNLIVNMADTTFCDSSGLRVLIQAHERIVSWGGTLTVKDPPEMFERLIAICALEDVIRVHHG